MIEFGENYYLIGKDEVTSDMEQLADGLYKSGEDLYEVICDKKYTSTTQTNPNNTRLSAKTSINYSGICFVLSVLLLSFTVLCFYLGINDIVNYEKIMNQSNQLGVIGETVLDAAHGESVVVERDSEHGNVPCVVPCTLWRGVYRVLAVGDLADVLEGGHVEIDPALALFRSGL